MTFHELRAIREGWGVTQGEVADALGIDIRTWGRYERGDHELPRMVEVVVWLMDGRPGARKKILSGEDLA